jgi:hypothetical protein
MNLGYRNLSLSPELLYEEIKILQLGLNLDGLAPGKRD